MSSAGSPNACVGEGGPLSQDKYSFTCSLTSFAFPVDDCGLLCSKNVSSSTKVPITGKKHGNNRVKAR
eukprot:10967207-Ditylum_brightwellii.AAC.1